MDHKAVSDVSERLLYVCVSFNTIEIIGLFTSLIRLL